ncbi:MAG: hypothetical protein E7582_00380 [Ruminococcaceae bacterium]|nr:hypothetical protein [Oscillospiraceae bacterium]
MKPKEKNRRSSSQKTLHARRDVSFNKKKNNKKRPIITAVISLFVCALALLGLWVLLSSPTIDTDSNPFDAQIMSNFGKNDSYNFTQTKRFLRPHNMGVIYNLTDFFAEGFVKGEDSGEVVRNTKAYNVLVVGKDRAGANTDVIMVVNFNSNTQKVNVLQIPRDTYVVDPINQNTSKRINAIYAFAYMRYKKEYSSSEASHMALKYLEGTIEDTFGITIDNYFMIDLNGFVSIIDSIGGVEVDVPFDMYYNDEEQNLHIDLKKGLQTLDGNQSEQFVRFRNTYVFGDLGRVSAQKIFLAALIEKLMSPEWYTLDKLSSVATDLIKYSTTGMTASDLVGFLKEINFKKFSSKSITFYTAPGEGYNASSGASYYSLYLDETLEVINKAFNLYNKKVTSSHVTLSEQYHSSYTKVDTDGSTAEDIGDNPPNIVVSRPYFPTTSENETTKDVTDETTNDVTDETTNDVTDETTEDNSTENEGEENYIEDPEVDNTENEGTVDEDSDETENTQEGETNG